MIDGFSSPDTLRGLPEPTCVVTPTPGVESVYKYMMARYKQLEENVAVKYGEK